MLSCSLLDCVGCYLSTRPGMWFHAGAQWLLCLTGWKEHLRPLSSFHRELDVLLPDIDYVEIPVDWWDAEADKSLLIGVFKHGMF